jgi:hypothetical protein
MDFMARNGLKALNPLPIDPGGRDQALRIRGECQGVDRSSRFEMAGNGIRGVEIEQMQIAFLVVMRVSGKSGGKPATVRRDGDCPGGKRIGSLESGNAGSVLLELPERDFSQRLEEEQLAGGDCQRPAIRRNGKPGTGYFPKR